MKIHLPLSPRRRLARIQQDNRELRGERNELMIKLAAASGKAEREAARADALEKANDELRSDLASWMDRREVSSDG